MKGRYLKFLFEVDSDIYYSLSSADVGPLITCAAKDRVESLIQSGVDEGATLLLDGRGIKVT